MKPRPYSKELEELRKNLELRLKNGIEYNWTGGFKPEFLVEGVMAQVETLIKHEKIEARLIAFHNAQTAYELCRQGDYEGWLQDRIDENAAHTAEIKRLKEDK